MVGDAFDDAVEDGLLDVESRSGAATLAVIEENRARSSFDRCIEIGILEDDVRRLAAEFERHLLQVARRGMHDEFSDFGGPGESDFVHVGMCRQGGACGLAIAWDNVDYA